MEENILTGVAIIKLNALRGQGSRFKASRDSRIPLAESIEAMENFISPQELRKHDNSGPEVAALIMDGDTVSRQ
ncbi:hypothetical protein PVK06_024433 [Gossypium arboreum]|uniref:Uncharacterized protein n=1 Tax=Gossypium arboreum TaxID=29729 RepID=A0ABR0PDX6_GOSAR|nr:hypothetical protein PVK06_024433 [Gossypium arboreum]